MEILKITDARPELGEIERLYTAAFPANERIPFCHMLEENPALDFCAAYVNGKFCGFFSLLTYRDLTHITFLAVEESMRGRGYGSEMLKKIVQSKPGNRIIADTEEVGDSYPNLKQRVRRKQFYLRNGFAETPVAYRWRHEDYRILSYGGSITGQDFENFWKNFR